MTQETHHGVTIPTTQPQAITVESDPETLAGARDGVQRNDQELPERKDEHIPPSPDAAERDSEATSLDNVIKNAKSLNRELKSEKDLRIKAESEVQHLNAKLKSVQVKWKRAAQALDKILSQTQGPIPATDEELETKAKQLRYKIRGFAIEYFDQSPARHPAELGTQYERYLPKYGQAWADSSKVIQAFFWKVFENHVFKSYLWAGRFSSSLDELCCNLTERKYQSETSNDTHKLTIVYPVQRRQKSFKQPNPSRSARRGAPQQQPSSLII
jgi:hypothetical protein